MGVERLLRDMLFIIRTNPNNCNNCPYHRADCDRPSNVEYCTLILKVEEMAKAVRVIERG